MKYILYSFMLLSTASNVVGAQPVSLGDTTFVSIDEGLSYVLRNEEPDGGLGVQLILRAGATENRSFTPLLQQIIAARAARRAGPDVNFDGETAAALHVLWHQGIGDEYFIGLVRGWPQDYALAVQAAYVLARTPTPEIVSFLEEVRMAARQSGRRDRMGGALSRARWIAFNIEQYEALPNVESRAEVVADAVAHGWSPMHSSQYERISKSGWMDLSLTDPYPIIIWGWFLSLSEEAPEVVARAIIEAVDERTSPLYPEDRPAHLDWVREISPPAVRDLLPENPVAHPPEDP